MGQVFLHLPPREIAAPGASQPTVNAYVIRNAKITGEHSIMSPLLVPILLRTIATLIQTQGVGDLYEIFDQAQAGGANFRLAYVPDDFEVDHHRMFEPAAMKKLFEAAHQMAIDGFPWLERPPDVL